LPCKTCWAKHHDAVVAAAWLRDAGVDSGEPERAFVAGRMAGACDHRRRSIERHMARKLGRV